MTLKSPILQEIPQPKHRVVSGVHRTDKGGVYFSLCRDDILRNPLCWLGADPLRPDSQYIGAPAFRELAQLFTEIATALEQE